MLTAEWTESRKWMPPLKKGEVSRKCEKCGSQFMPNSRNQKYCHDCKKKGR